MALQKWEKPGHLGIRLQRDEIDLSLADRLFVRARSGAPIFGEAHQRDLERLGGLECAGRGDAELNAVHAEAERGVARLVGGTVDDEDLLEVLDANGQLMGGIAVEGEVFDVQDGDEQPVRLDATELVHLLGVEPPR